jgi:hypothetical protein
MEPSPRARYRKACPTRQGVRRAVRLLGPVALEIIRSDAVNSIPLARLRQLVEKPLRANPISTLKSPDEAIALFQRELGLLVEVEDGAFGFLRPTLAEYFAALQLTSSGELEKSYRRPRKRFRRGGARCCSWPRASWASGRTRPG